MNISLNYDDSGPEKQQKVMLGPVPEKKYSGLRRKQPDKNKVR